MLIAVAQYRPDASWKLVPASQARTKQSQGEKLNRLQVCGAWEARAARALFFEPSQSCRAPGLSCPIRGTIAIATSARNPDSTHWGCHSTTPAVRLTPGRRSNGLSKQSRFALFALPFRFSPAERISVMSNLLTLIFSSITHEWTGNGGWDTTHRTICPKIMLYSGQIESLITKCPDQLRRTVLVHKLHVL